MKSRAHWSWILGGLVLLPSGFLPSIPAPSQEGSGKSKPATRPAGDPSAQGRKAEPATRSAPSQTTPPEAAAPERRDLIQRFPIANPFLGVWKVRRKLLPGAHAGTQVTGYLIFTRTHMSLHLMQRSPLRAGRPDFQSSIRRYFIQGPLLRSTSLMGVRSDPGGGKLLLEAQGLVEQRRYLFLGPGVLRIYQGPQSYLELVKEADL